MTADNASNNNVLIDELGDLDNSFAGRANQVRCFAHIINLIAKSILRQFEVTKGRTSDDTADEKTADILADLAAGLDLEDEPVYPMELSEDEDEKDGAGEGGEGEESDEVDVDDVDGWIDEREDLSDEEREELRESVLPLKLALAKVCLRTYMVLGPFSHFCTATKALRLHQ